MILCPQSWVLNHEVACPLLRGLFSFGVSYSKVSLYMYVVEPGG